MAALTLPWWWLLEQGLAGEQVAHFQLAGSLLVPDFDHLLSVKNCRVSFRTGLKKNLQKRPADCTQGMTPCPDLISSIAPGRLI